MVISSALYKCMPVTDVATVETPLNAGRKLNCSKEFCIMLARQWGRLQAICVITDNYKFTFHLLHIRERGYQCFPHRGIYFLWRVDSSLWTVPSPACSCFPTFAFPSFAVISDACCCWDSGYRLFDWPFKFLVLWFNACGKGDTNRILPNRTHRIRSSCKEEEARRAGSWSKIEARLAVIRTVPSVFMPLRVSGGGSSGPYSVSFVFMQKLGAFTGSVWWSHQGPVDIKLCCN